MNGKRTKDSLSRGVRVHVAAFGKHPGWDDHIEEIGLDSDALVHAKRVLYTEGLAGNIDSGAWEKLDPEQRQTGFKHQFYWRTGEGLLVGRMWSSRDGKGRTKYPMVVCAMIDGVPDAWAVEQIIPRLAVVEEKCAQTNSAELVRLAIGEARRGIEDAAALLVASDTGGVTPEALLSRLLDHPDMARAQGGAEGDRRLGIVRVLYEIEREMGAYRPASVTSKGRTRIAEPAAQHLRVRKCLTGPGEAARAWMTLLDQEIATSTKVLVLEPSDHDFIDIIVGDPRPAQLYCVRAGEKALGLTSDVPYTMDPAFRGEAETRIAAWARGEITGRARSKDASRDSTAIGAGGGKGKLVAAGVGVAVVVAGLLMYFMSGKSSPPSGAGGTATAPSTPTTPPPKQSPRESTPEKPLANTTPAQPAPKPPASTPPDAPAVAGDPRADWSIDNDLARVESSLKDLESELAQEGAAPDAALRDRLGRLTQRVTILRAMTWNTANKDTITRDKGAIDNDVAELSRQAAAARTACAQRVREYLTGLGSTPPVRTDTMRRAWSDGLGKIDAAAGWASAKRQAAELSTALQTGEAAVGDAQAPTVPADSTIDAKSIGAAVEGARDRALEAASQAAAAGDASRAKAAGEQFRSWMSSAREFVDLGLKIESQLKGGFGADQAPPGGESLDAMAARIRDLQVYREFDGAVGPLMNDYESLKSVGPETEVPELIGSIRDSAANTSGRRASEGVAAWNELVTRDWPGDSASLAQAKELLTGPLKTISSRIADAARREAVENQIVAGARTAWSTHAVANAGSEAGLTESIESAPAFSVDEPTRAALPEWARFNASLLALKRAAAAAQSLDGPARAEAQRGAIAQFLGTVGGLGSAAQAPQVQSLTQALTPLLDAASQIELGKLGPGAAGWTASSPAADGSSVTFRWTHGNRNHELEFRRVTPPGSQAVSFMATTECSVGMFMDLVQAAGAWDAIRPMLSSYPAGGDDTRRGPRVWEWSVKPGEVMAVGVQRPGDSSRGWYRFRSWLTQQACYPEGAAPEPPSVNHPMQYVSPGAAVFAARLAGCRLPTPEEWKAATNASAEAGTPNLRDAAWKRQYDHTKRLEAMSPEWPSGGMFWPLGATKVQPPQDGVAATDADDGLVWFSPVATGSANGPYLNLRGNVAEWAFEDAASLESITPPAADRIRSALGKGEKLRVVGGSALSGKDLSTTEPLPVNISQANEGYSDVGFRLAFSAPKSAAAASAEQRLTAALEQSQYLSGDR